MNSSTMIDDDISLIETLPVIGLLLGGVPTLTIFVMAAVHYVASGSL